MTAGRFFAIALMGMAPCTYAGLFFKNAPDSTRQESKTSQSKDSVELFLKGLGHAEAPISFDQGHDPIIVSQVELADSMEEQRSRAHSVDEAVRQAGRYRESLDATTVVDLPIGIVKSGGSLDYSIVIDKITFSPLGSELTTYMSFTIPQTGDRIAFGGKIPLSKDGGIIGIARVFLLGDYSIKLNNSTLLTLKGSLKNNTFVEIDCDGFKAMSIEADIEFSRDVLVPEDEKGAPVLESRLKINFQTYVQDWNGLLVKVSVPPFQVRSLAGFGFAAQDAWLDWSDLANPVGLVFPTGYHSTFGAPRANLWRGFFLRKAEIRLPSKFQEQGNGARLRFGVENLIVDDTGFSGQAFTENLIKEGDMNGWSYSLDRLRISIVGNLVSQFEFQGRISIPPLENENKPVLMSYSASRDVYDNYVFAVKVLDKLNIPLWAAAVNLYNGSSVVVKEKNNKFYPTAILNGMMSIKTMDNGPKAELVAIRFEQLQISTEEPYLKSGIFGIGNPENTSRAAGFPIVIRSIGVKSNQSENKLGLSFDVTINIGGEPSKEGFSGTAGLTVWGTPSGRSLGQEKKLPSDKEKKEWKFDGVELTAVGISVKKPNVVDLNGSVRFFEDDPVYGDGFKGDLKGSFHQKIMVQAAALFGRTENFRYWFADALVVMKGGIQLAPGLAAYGFGGGYYSRMRQDGEKKVGIGTTPSGISYLPDENSTGLRALLAFGSTGSERAFNGDVTFEMLMNKSGGINAISLVGTAYFLTPAVTIEPGKISEEVSKITLNSVLISGSNASRGQIYGKANLLFDNLNNVFHGDAEVFVNTAGGLLKGTGTSYKAGWTTFHFAPDEWYVLIGTPGQPIGLEVARLFKARSYMMVGENLPGSPPPPENMSQILGGVDLGGSRDLNALQSASGFALGMSFGVDTGDLRFLMFYGRFAAGAGFDIMLKNYGETHQCEGSSSPMGINGWYANGQAYAYVEGKIGIKVDLKFYKGEYDILAIGTAATLQVKGPSPFLMKGIVGGNYRVLGGLVKGLCRFELTIGDECKPVQVSNPLQDVRMIADVSPANGLRDVDVFSAPQTAFNVPIGEVFTITNSENRLRNFRARLAEFSVKSGNTSIDGSLKWNETHDVVVWDPVEVLPPQTEIRIIVKVAFEEQVGTTWQTVILDGKSADEVAESSFTSGKAPGFVPLSNIELSYPLQGQFNFYPKESDRGFIKLKKGQAYLFSPGPEWIQKGRLTEAGSMQSYNEFDFSYSDADRTLRFLFPTGLSLGKVYRFELLNIPRREKLIDENVTTVSAELVKEEQGAASLSTRQIQGNLELLDAKSIYSSYFRTSAFATFSEKTSRIGLSSVFRKTLTPNVFQLCAYLKANELFDGYEIGGSSSTKPLVQLEAILDKNNWYQDQVYPIVYEGYPLLGTIQISNRDTKLLGLPPAKSVFIDEQGFNSSVNDQGLISSGAPSSYSQVAYDLMNTMFSDYAEIQTKVADYAVERPDRVTERLKKILLNRLPIYRKGKYKIRLSYLIPGDEKASSTADWELLNEIPD